MRLDSTRTTAKSLQRFLPQWVKRPASFVGPVLGYDHAYPSVPASLRTLASWGYQPEFVLDVGAYVGSWTKLFRQCLGETNVLMIEPQENKRAQLTEICAASPGSTRYANALLGPEAGLEVDFFEMETGSSVLSEMTPWDRTVVRKQTSTMDDLVNEHQDWGKPDFIKLDVQGYELEVLRGGRDTMADAAFVLLEVAFAPYNEGAPLAAEVIAFMEEAGYTLIDVSSQMRREDGALLQSDLLFMNRASGFVTSWSQQPS
jgi:FkbM family methyltransferase